MMRESFTREDAEGDGAPEEEEAVTEETRGVEPAGFRAGLREDDQPEPEAS